VVSAKKHCGLYSLLYLRRDAQLFGIGSRNHRYLTESALPHRQEKDRQSPIERKYNSLRMKRNLPNRLAGQVFSVKKVIL